MPRQATTGGKPRLLDISKRGNKYLCYVLVHGARSALPQIANRSTPQGEWVRGLLARRHKNIATVALAQKTARIIWAVLVHQRHYRADYMPLAA